MSSKKSFRKVRMSIISFIIIIALVFTFIPVNFIFAEPAATLSSSPEQLSESNLSSAVLTVGLSDDTFVDDVLDPINFTLNNAPDGLDIESVAYISSSQADISLAFNDTDFDTDINNFSVTVSGTELSSSSDITSNEITITAIIETEGDESEPISDLFIEFSENSAIDTPENPGQQAWILGSYNGVKENTRFVLSIGEIPGDGSETIYHEHYIEDNMPAYWNVEGEPATWPYGIKVIPLDPKLSPGKYSIKVEFVEDGGDGTRYTVAERDIQIYGSDRYFEITPGYADQNGDPLVPTKLTVYINQNDSEANYCTIIFISDPDVGSWDPIIVGEPDFQSEGDYWVLEREYDLPGRGYALVVGISDTVNSDPFPYHGIYSFSIEQTAELPNPPAISASITYNWVYLENFSPDTDIDILINGTDTYTTHTDADGNSFAEVWQDGIEITPGMHIEVTDPIKAITKVLNTVDISLDTIDIDQDIIYGTGPEGAEIIVGADTTNGWHEITVTVGGGTWSADFGAEGFDLDDNAYAQARLFDEDDDYTVAELTPQPVISASITYNWVNLENFSPDTDIDILINGTNTYTTHTDGDGNSFAEVWQDGIKIVPGTHIEVTDPIKEITKVLNTIDLSLDTVDKDTDIVSGTGPEGTEVRIGANNATGYLELTATVTGGVWSANFGAEGFNLDEETYVQARIYDADDDYTVAELPPLNIIECYIDQLFYYGIGEEAYLTLSAINCQDLFWRLTTTKEGDPGFTLIQDGQIPYDSSWYHDIAQSVGGILYEGVYTSTWEFFDTEQDRDSGTNAVASTSRTYEIWPHNIDFSVEGTSTPFEARFLIDATDADGRTWSIRVSPKNSPDFIRYEDGTLIQSDPQTGIWHNEVTITLPGPGHYTGIFYTNQFNYDGMIEFYVNEAGDLVYQRFAIEISENYGNTPDNPFQRATILWNKQGLTPGSIFKLLIDDNEIYRETLYSHWESVVRNINIFPRLQPGIHDAKVIIELPDGSQFIGGQREFKIYGSERYFTLTPGYEDELGNIFPTKITVHAENAAGKPYTVLIIGKDQDYGQNDIIPEGNNNWTLELDYALPESSYGVWVAIGGGYEEYPYDYNGNQDFKITQEGSPYTYDALRAMAESGENYEGSPAAGHAIAFANILASIEFCQEVQASIIEQWQKAGGSPDDLIIKDNDYNVETGLTNAQDIFGSRAEVFIEFQFDKTLNEWIAANCPENKYIVAVDVPVPGFPFMGVNNQTVGEMAGNWAKDQISAIGWESVDNIFYNRVLEMDEEVRPRWLAPADVLVVEYGSGADPDTAGSKASWFDAVGFEEAKDYFSQWLQTNPDPQDGHTNVVFCINDQVAQGLFEALSEAGRWDASKWLIIAQGFDSLGEQLVNDGIIDADVAYFPENYGKYLIPAALAYIYGNPVPEYMCVQNRLITGYKSEIIPPAEDPEEPIVTIIDATEQAGTIAEITSTGEVTVELMGLDADEANNQGFYIPEADNYYDLRLTGYDSGAQNVQEIKFTIKDAIGIAKWWNGTEWIDCSDYAYSPDEASGPDTVITINANTIPRLDQLTGTEFVVVSVTASDKEAPVIIINSPIDGAYYNSTTLPSHPEITVTDNMDPNPNVEINGWDTSEGTHTLVITATDASGNSSSASVVYTVDNTAPEVTLNTPYDGAKYLLNDTVYADFDVADSLSGIQSISSTLQDGQALDTSTPGTKTFTVTATDKAGNTTTVTSTYKIVYEFIGFLPPVNDIGNSVFLIKFGRVIPFKFQLKDANGDYVANAMAKITTTQHLGENILGNEIEIDTFGFETSGDYFRYDGSSNQYIYNMSTRNLEPGTWLIRVYLDDDTSQFILISAKK